MGERERLLRRIACIHLAALRDSLEELRLAARPRVRRQTKPTPPSWLGEALEVRRGR